MGWWCLGVRRTWVLWVGTSTLRKLRGSFYGVYIAPGLTSRATHGCPGHLEVAKKANATRFAHAPPLKHARCSGRASVAARAQSERPCAICHRQGPGHARSAHRSRAVGSKMYTGWPFEVGCRGSEVPRPNPKHSRVVRGWWDGNLEPR